MPPSTLPSCIVLSIDIGTTAVKLAVLSVNYDNATSAPLYHLLFTHTQSHNAAVPGLSPTHAEQDVWQIVRCIAQCVAAIPVQLRGIVEHISLTGQQHGVVVYDEQAVRTAGQAGRCTNLVTWEDQRCNTAFLNELHQLTGHSLSTGYGCATLAWYQRDEQHQWISDAASKTRAGSIVDLVAALLLSSNDNDAQVPTLPMHPTMSHSFGLTNETGNWDVRAVDKAGIPQYLLPHVATAATQPVWHIPHDNPLATQWQLKAGVTVGVGVGDAPAQAHALMQNEIDAVLNIGTSLQFTSLSKAARHVSDPHAQLRPSLSSHRLNVLASLNGGNVIHWLATQLRQLVYQQLSLDQVYEQMLQAATTCANTRLQFVATLYGERSQPTASAIYDNDIIIDRHTLILPYAALSQRGWSTGDIVAATLRGIIENVYRMCTNNGDDTAALQHIKRIRCCGTAATRNPLLVRYVQQVFGVETDVVDDTTSSYAACIGAALHAATTIGQQVDAAKNSHASQLHSRAKHSAAYWKQHLQLEDLPGESGEFKVIRQSDIRVVEQTHAAQSTSPAVLPAGNTIYYQLSRDKPVNVWHWLASDDTHSLLDGGPCEYYILSCSADGQPFTVQLHTLGYDVEAGQQPVICVPGNSWKAIRLCDNAEFALMASSLAPAWTPDAARLKIKLPTEEARNFQRLPNSEWLTKQLIQTLNNPSGVIT